MAKNLIDKIHNNIVIVRLNNREHDVIGILLDLNDIDISLGNPFFINIHDGEMMPYCILSDEKVYKVKFDNIEFIAPSKDQVKEEYMNIIFSERKPDNNITEQRIVH